MFGSQKIKSRDVAQRLISGHVALMAYWALKHAGVLEAMLRDETAAVGLEPQAFAESAKLSPAVLEALLRYMAQAGLVLSRDGRAFLTAEGRALVEQENGVLELVRSYSGVMEILEHLLVGLKTATPGAVRRYDAANDAQHQRWLPEVYPALETLVLKLKLTHLLDVACGTGELLKRLAKRNNKIVGVGIGNDGAQVRRANQMISAAALEKRLIAVTASPIETLMQTQKVFERIGISQQLWEEIDAVLIPYTLGETTGLNREVIVKTLAKAARNFPKAKLVLIEPCMGARFDKNYYAPEWSLLLSLVHTPLWPVEEWRSAIREAGLRLVNEVPLVTDGTTVFVISAQ